MIEMASKMLVKFIVISVWAIFVFANDIEILEGKLTAVHTSLSAEIAVLKEDLHINVLPEIERLKRVQCSCPEINTANNGTRNTPKADNTYVQKIEDKLKAFHKAINYEKVRANAITSRIEALGDALGKTQKDNSDSINRNRQSLENNTIRSIENSKDIVALSSIVDSIVDSTRIISEKIANISKCIDRDCSMSSKAIKPPSFVSQWFLMKSQDVDLSERVIEHGLNDLPIKADVQIKATAGPGEEWIFTGDCVFQSEDDLNDEYGGVVYLYNETHVHLRAPKKNNNRESGVLINTGEQSERFIQESSYRFTAGLVRVRAWLQEDFPSPVYTSDWLSLNTEDSKKSFYEISHGLSEYPAFVTVQIRSDSGFVSEGMGAVMSSLRAWADTGGVLYGYDDKTVRIWTSYVSKEGRFKWGNGYGGLFGSFDGWGVTGIRSNRQGDVKVTVWTADSFIQGKTIHKKVSNVQENKLSTMPLQTMNIDIDMIMFHVQALDGPNRGFMLKGYGSNQAQVEPFGGVIYAYNQKGQIKVWRPNEDRNGFLIHINEPYGNGKLNQASNSAAYQITVLESKS